MEYRQDPGSNRKLQIADLKANTWFVLASALESDAAPDVARAVDEAIAEVHLIVDGQEKGCPRVIVNLCTGTIVEFEQLGVWVVPVVPAAIAKNVITWKPTGYQEWHKFTVKGRCDSAHFSKTD